MTLPQFIGTALNGDANVTGIVGTRIFHGQRPQEIETLPAINYFQVAELEFTSAIVATVDYQISCRDRKELDALNLADAVAESLVNSAPRTEAGLDVQSIEFGSRALLFEPDIDAIHVPLTLRFVLANTLT